MKKYKSNSGITLIALVIIIIVTIILAGISVSAITGNNSLIERANEAKTLTEKKQLKELILEKWYEYERKNIGKNLADGTIESEFQSKIRAELNDNSYLVEIETKTVEENVTKKTVKVTYKGNLLVSIPI